MQSFFPSNSWLPLCLHVFHTGCVGLAKAEGYVKEARFYASGVVRLCCVQGCVSCTPFDLHRHSTC
jgi:hypothetical protein